MSKNMVKGMVNETDNVAINDDVRKQPLERKKYIKMIRVFTTNLSKLYQIILYTSLNIKKNKIPLQEK